jgi:hypothetical protein
MPDLLAELHGLHHLAALTGLNIANVRPALPEIGECALDVLFDFEGRRCGAQHTGFHSDEGHTAGQRGSLLRAEETAKSARAPNGVYGMFGKLDYRPALTLRIDEKIAKAATHDNRRIVGETWLVISASIAKPGAVAATSIARDIVRESDLNAISHTKLAASDFDRAFLLLHMSNSAFGWDAEGGWRLLADPDAGERRRHGEMMSDLIFNQIPAFHRKR